MGPPTSARPRRSRAGLFLFLLVLGLAAWEVAARVSGAAVTPVRFAGAAWNVAAGRGGGLGAGSDELDRIYIRPLPYMMWGLKPGWTRESKDGKARTSNRHGFRGPDFAVPKPQGTYRIVCLGGSTTYDDQVDDADTYPVQLEAFLRQARPGRSIEVINAGVPSYTSAESLASLAFVCVDLQPDAILIYDNINDYRPRLYPNFDPAYFHYRKIWDGSARLKETGEPGSEMQGINSYLQWMPPEPLGDKAENARRAGTWAFRRNLLSMCGIAKAHGIAIVLATVICDAGGINSEPLLVDSIAEQNQVMKQVAAEQGALLIDLAAAYPQGDFYAEGDPIHNNAAGAKEKARIIADGLLQGLLQ